MGRLHMAAKAHLIGEGLLYVAVAHKASQRSQLHALDLALAVRIVYGVVGAVLVTVVALPSVKSVPRQVLVRGDDDLIKLCLAKRAIFVLHKETNAETALSAHVGMPTDAHGKELNRVEAQDAVFCICIGDLLLTDSAVNSGSGLHHFV